MSKQVGCTPTSSIGGLPYLICASVAWQSLLLTSYLSYGLLSPMIVLIDVSLSHLLSSSSTFFLFRLLGVKFLAHAHPLHECSIYRKGVDQFDLYLASGLGTSPDQNRKETKCETLVESCSQQPFLSFFPVPCLHANTIWRHSSHGQRERLHLLFFCYLC